jgi:pimeloyl-ACP methyl ester carboxylesterase
VPVVTSSYLPPRFLRHGHTATILASFFPAGPDQWSAFERLELPDSDFLDLAWMLHPSPRPAPLAILSHGLEGSFNAPYIRSLARTLHAAGWNILAWNYRSCGGIPNRLPQSYHSGASDDLRLVVSHAAPRASTIALVGFSLGGNLTLKYAAESPPHPAFAADALCLGPHWIYDSTEIARIYSSGLTRYDAPHSKYHPGKRAGDFTHYGDQTLALLRRLGNSAPGPFFAAGRAGQINAALFAAACLAPHHPKIRHALDLFRKRQTSSVPQKP